MHPITPTHFSVTAEFSVSDLWHVFLEGSSSSYTSFSVVVVSREV